MNQQTISRSPIQITISLDKTTNHTPSFYSAFQQAATEALVTLGEPARRVIFKCLENDFGIAQNNLGANPAAFAGALERIFGSDAAWLVEARIIRELHDLVPEFKYTSNNDQLFFLDYIAALNDFLL